MYKEAVQIPGANSVEIGPGHFPVIEDAKKYSVYSFEGAPDAQEDKIIHFQLNVDARGKKQNRFLLLKMIGGLHYIFSLTEAIDEANIYHLNFKTEEYEYATTGLDQEASALLFATAAGFVESIARSSPDRIKEIRISPADASYSAQEIEECMKKILASPANTLTREQLIAEHKGFRIFDFYSQLFGEDFLEQHYNQQSRAPARARLFKRMIKRYFPEWKIEEDYVMEHDFVLRRKKTSKT